MVIVPELLAVVGALLAAMFVYAIVIVAKGFAGLFPTDIPILSTIHRFFYNIALVGGAAASWIMSDFIRPLINAIVGPILGFIRMLEGLANFASEAAHSWVWLLTKGIPGLASRLTSLIVAGVHRAYAYALRLYHAAVAYVVAEVKVVERYAVALVHNLARAVLHDLALVKAYAVAIVHNLAVAVVHDIAVVKAYAIALVHTEVVALSNAIRAVDAKVAALSTGIIKLIRSEVATGVQAAEQFAVAEAAHAIHIVDVDAAAAIAAVAPGIIDDVGKLIDTIGTDLPDIGAAVRAIPRDIPGDLAASLTMVGALSVPMLRFMRECGIPNCRNLSQFGRELRDLLGALEDGALIAFLAMLCTDPEGAASFVTDDIGGVIDGAVSAARDLMGVA
jgi:hypothetical protein